MFEKFFSMLGRQIRHTVQDVVHSDEFHDLKQEITDDFKDLKYEFKGTARQTRERRREHHRNRRAGEEPATAPYGQAAQPLRYSDANFPWKQVSSILLLIFGGMFGVVAALTALGTVIAAFTGYSMYMLGTVLGTVILPFGGMSGFMLTKGCKIRGRLYRVKRYLQAVSGVKFCAVEQLAKVVNKTPAFVVNDLEKMIQIRMLPDGFLDDQKTCLMLGQDTYQQYLQARHSKEEREQREAEKGSQPETAVTKGRDSLQQMRQAKDFIRDEEIYTKISRLESIIEKILNYVEKNPTKQPQLRKFNDYYLPTTLKLIHSYCHLDMQPIQGENITTAKEQIRDSLDTINTAFENLLDSLFGDTTLDISSDISVLEAMLAREGLTGDDFKPKKD